MIFDWSIDDNSSHVDETYDIFAEQVCEFLNMSRDDFNAKCCDSEDEFESPLSSHGDEHEFVTSKVDIRFRTRAPYKRDKDTGEIINAWVWVFTLKNEPKIDYEFMGLPVTSERTLPMPRPDGVYIYGKGRTLKEAIENSHKLIEHYCDVVVQKSQEYLDMIETGINIKEQ